MNPSPSLSLPSFIKDASFFRCVHASLYEGLSVRRSVGSWLVGLEVTALPTYTTVWCLLDLGFIKKEFGVRIDSFHEICQEKPFIFFLHKY